MDLAANGWQSGDDSFRGRVPPLLSIDGTSYRRKGEGCMEPTWHSPFRRDVGRLEAVTVRAAASLFLVVDLLSTLIKLLNQSRLNRR